MPRPSGPLSGAVDPRWSVSMRPVADGFLPDTATVTRAASPAAGTLNRTSGVRTPAAATTVLSGAACQVRLVDSEPDFPLTGAQRVTVRQYDVKLRVGAADVRAEDTLTVTAVGPLGDPTLVGRKLRVLSVAHTSVAWTRLLRAQADEG